MVVSLPYHGVKSIEGRTINLKTNVGNKRVFIPKGWMFCTISPPKCYSTQKKKSELSKFISSFILCYKINEMLPSDCLHLMLKILILPYHFILPVLSCLFLPYLILSHLFILISCVNSFHFIIFDIWQFIDSKCQKYSNNFEKR